MAMIRCAECGKEVSSLAKMCPNCGAPILGLRKKICIHFHRAKKFKGSAISGTIYLDGQRVGTADNGCSFDVMTFPGEHILSAETATNDFKTGGKGNTVNISVPENATLVDVEIGLQTHLWGAAVVISNVNVQQ